MVVSNCFRNFHLQNGEDPILTNILQSRWIHQPVICCHSYFFWLVSSPTGCLSKKMFLLTYELKKLGILNYRFLLMYAWKKSWAYLVFCFSLLQVFQFRPQHLPQLLFDIRLEVRWTRWPQAPGGLHGWQERCALVLHGPCLLGQWLTFQTFGDSIFSRENQPFKQLFFRVCSDGDQWDSRDFLEDHPSGWGKWIHLDEYLSNGWFNHQLVVRVS